MKCTVLLFAFVLPASLTTGQNLVPNPSFEEYIDCPYATGEFHAQVVDWYSFALTPDYFHVCSNDLEAFAGVPDNEWGFQQPISGEAYAGLVTYTSTFDYDEREYIACPLLLPLVPGTDYYVMFYISLFDGGSLAYSQCATDRIGAKFFMENNYGPQQTNWYLPNNDSDIQKNGFITDNDNWSLIDGWFMADSAYQWLAIGNFFTDALTDTIQMGWPGQCNSLYYIENVCVATDPEFCQYLLNVEKVNSFEHSISLFPNPSEGRFTIDAKGEIIGRIDLFDIAGKWIKTEYPSNDKFLMDASELEKGLYLLNVLLSNGRSKTFKIITQ